MFIKLTDSVSESPCLINLDKVVRFVAAPKYTAAELDTLKEYFNNALNKTNSFESTRVLKLQQAAIENTTVEMEGSETAIVVDESLAEIYEIFTKIES